jgi:hypothetical protein
MHCKENPIYILPEKKLSGLSPNFHIHGCERFFYFHDRFIYFFPAAE